MNDFQPSSSSSSSYDTAVGPPQAMTRDMYETLVSNVEHVTGAISQSAPQGEESFLRDVVTTDAYLCGYAEAWRNKNGKASHLEWRNYDDLNEYFWAKKCFKLGWPWDRKVDFFIHSDVIKLGNKILAKEMSELLEFSKNLVHLEPASKIPLKSLAEEMQAVSKGLEKVEQELTVAENDGAVSLGF